MINDEQHVTPTVIVTSGASLTQYTCPQIISWDPILWVSWCTSMLFADCEHLENSIKHSWVEQALQNEHLFFI